MTCKRPDLEQSVQLSAQHADTKTTSIRSAQQTRLSNKLRARHKHQQVNRCQSLTERTLQGSTPDAVDKAESDPGAHVVAFNMQRCASDDVPRIDRQVRQVLHALG